MKETFEGKIILVTGGCGSIGSEIVNQLLEFNPKRVRVFDNHESGLFHLERRLKYEKKEKAEVVRYLLGDVRDKERVKMAMKDVDIVFHAAALKHVPLCEYNPSEAVKTNVYGTQNVIDAAREEGVEKFIFISTDKAVNPINTMGATKLLGEKLTLTAPIGDCKTKFSCVRFGNVLNSNASVIPIFKEQIKYGGPVTITSRDMTRFFMSLQEAVNLLLEAVKTMSGREIFILKMNAIRIIDLAEIMIEELAPRYGYKKEDIKIEEIGIRPGEKLHESLLSEEEIPHVLETHNMYILKLGISTPGYIEKGFFSKDTKISVYSSINVKILNKEEIREMLYKYKIL